MHVQKSIALLSHEHPDPANLGWDVSLDAAPLWGRGEAPLPSPFTSHGCHRRGPPTMICAFSPYLSSFSWIPTNHESPRPTMQSAQNKYSTRALCVQPKSSTQQSNGRSLKKEKVTGSGAKSRIPDLHSIRAKHMHGCRSCGKLEDLADHRSQQKRGHQTPMQYEKGVHQPPRRS